MLTVRTDWRSPNFDDVVIDVAFLLVHYTAGDLERARHHFLDERAVSCHLMIAEDGTVFELVEVWDGRAKRAWHAGLSRWVEDGVAYSDLNQFSIGIELVNGNGNVVPFTEAQYTSLAACLKHLGSHYPALLSPNRILGHEHVAGWRGKADPGLLFDWSRLFRDVYPGERSPQRDPVCPKPLAEALSAFLPILPENRSEAVKFWRALSLTTEAAVRLMADDGSAAQ